jgi:2-polyprenyl-3-methyl-5-hydroxy-6-metoxy-1,4-benzoquinol methylase
VKNSYRYFFLSLWKNITFRGRACPSCGGQTSEVLDRKWLVTAFRQCGRCHLRFRTPTTTPEENARFYQADYTEGFTTDLPSDSTLAGLLSENFRGTEKDYSDVVRTLTALGIGAGKRLYDFGCSWGYGSFQLGKAGNRVDAYEISEPRAAYARTKLGVKLVPPEAAETGAYDVFFSSHVLEHVPSVSTAIELGRRLLKPGGWFVAYTPNGSDDFRRTNPAAWHKLWGFVHPQLLTPKYFASQFGDAAVLTGSTPVRDEDLKGFPDTASDFLPATGSELLLVARKKAE